jgi:hypothetical protein
MVALDGLIVRFKWKNKFGSNLNKLYLFNYLF